MAQLLVERSAAPIAIATDVRADVSSRPRSHSNLDAAFSPVNTDGCFEFDRVLKSGWVDKRTRRTKGWKRIYIVLRPTAVSMYKSDKEDRLRHQVYLSELTAVANLKDPKQRRPNVFGLFSPSRNYHFQAPSAQDAREWVELIRKVARIEEEDEMFLAGPEGNQHQSMARAMLHNSSMDQERFLSSSPEPLASPNPRFSTSRGRRRSSILESSGLSGGELASHSDFSDNEGLRMPGASIESLAVQQPLESIPRSSIAPQPGFGIRSASQTSVTNLEQDPYRVMWQGWLELRLTGQWKDKWAVLRPRNLILYKNEEEYKAQCILELPAIINVVDSSVSGSKSKTRHFQVITEEKTYRFRAKSEDEFLKCFGAFKSLLFKRRELEARAAAGTATSGTAINTTAAKPVPTGTMPTGPDPPQAS